jgi:hypothetical protein
MLEREACGELGGLMLEALKGHTLEAWGAE